MSRFQGWQTKIFIIVTGDLNLDEVNDNKVSPLEIALQYSEIEVACHLLEMGAKLGRQPLDTDVFEHFLSQNCMRITTTNDLLLNFNIFTLSSEMDLQDARQDTEVVEIEMGPQRRPRSNESTGGNASLSINSEFLTGRLYFWTLFFSV